MIEPLANSTAAPPSTDPTLRVSTKTTPLALITGGSAGLGFVIAETFAEAGYDVVITGRNQERLETAAERLRSIGQVCVNTIRCDVTDPDQVQAVAQALQTQVGRLDVLVNCVGESDRGLVMDLGVQRVHELIDQNLSATLICSQAMMPLLRACHGSVVNIGSLAGKVGARYLGGYNLAKHALTGLTQQMRLEWKEHDIHVSIVHPGPIRRDDTGSRYAAKMGGDLPSQASKPGGGTKLKGLDPKRVAEAVLKCARRKRSDVVLPGYLRLLITIGNAFPRLGDWILLSFTS
jgi:short-subunit dehydrogenase